MKLTLEELKELITISGLDHRKQNAYGTCPSCGDKEFGISLADNHRFGCFRKSKCGFNGNIFTLLRFLGKKIMDVKPGFEFRAKLENKIEVAEEKELDLTMPDVTMPMGWRRITHDPYLESRGFTKEDYDKFPVGVSIDSRFKDMVIFKVIQNGSTKGYIGRNRKTKKQIEKINKQYKEQGIDKRILRYKNSSATDFSKLLLGIEEFTEKTHTAILIEGLFDKHNTDKRLSLPDQEEVKACCTFKCGCSDEQILLLQQAGIQNVVLLYDPDVIAEIKKASWNLERYFNVQIGFQEYGRDPGDMTEEDFEEVLTNLKTPSQFEVNKMSVLELRKK